MTSREIAIEFLRNNMKIPTRTAARILSTEHPDIWTYNSARGMVQRLRGEKEKDSRIKDIEIVKELKRSYEEKKMAIQRKFESDYKEIKPYYVDAKKVLILSDIHFPYHDIKALETAIDYGVKKGCDMVYLNGDTLDMYQASRYTKDPRLMSIPDEIAMGRDFLIYLKELFPKVVFKVGNHDLRIEDYMKLKAPELYGFTEFRLDSLLQLNSLGIDYVSSTTPSYMGSLIVLHGHEFGHSVFSPVNPARGLYLRSKTSAIIGHHHQTSEHSEKDAKNKVTTCWSVGCLCGLQPEYYPFNKWNHGFAFVEIDGSDFEVSNKRIIDGIVR